MESFLDKIHISGAVKYRSMFIAGGFLHSIFLYIFFSLDVTPMIPFNFGSIILYLLGFFFSVKKGENTMRFGWLVAFYSEILIHAVVCTLLMGWVVNFHLYAVAVLAIASYALYLAGNIKKFTYTMIVFILIDAAAFIAVMLILHHQDYIPPYQFERSEFLLISYLNTIFTAVLILLFSTLFILEIHGLIRQLNLTNSRLEYTATHDALTGLYNRHSLKHLFEKLEKENTDFCIVLGDIDDFKKVNDTYGHDCGDIVLKTISKLILDGIQMEDIACRWGGEEILIIMYGSKGECIERLSAIREKINAANVHHNSREVHISMTFGFATCNEKANGIEALISTSDARLYKGKKSGKNVIVTQ